MKPHKQMQSLVVLLIELVLTFCICAAIAFANLGIVTNQVSRYTSEIETDYHNLAERYLSVFKVMTVQIKEEIAGNPSFADMQSWLQKHEDVFAEAVGRDIYDGFAMTYKGGYAHRWNYGDYSKYDPNTRPWYQESARAKGEPVVVASYFSYLGAS